MKRILSVIIVVFVVFMTTGCNKMYIENVVYDLIKADLVEKVDE